MHTVCDFSKVQLFSMKKYCSVAFIQMVTQLESFQFKLATEYCRNYLVAW